MSEAVIRPYSPRDRSRVREICVATGYLGTPATWYWRDAQSYADLFTSYYTDDEPESAFVADIDGDVVGFLLGCVDSSRQGNPLAPLVPHVLARGLAFRPGTARFIWRSAYDIASDAVHKRLAPTSILDDRWPSHLHIDLMPQACGHHFGTALVEAWFAKLKALGSPGCHLETLAENTRAIAFFESVGFQRHRSPFLVPGLRSPARERHHVQVMVQEFGTSPAPDAPMGPAA